MSFGIRLWQTAIVLEPGVWTAVAATISGVCAVLAARASKIGRRARKRTRRPKTRAQQPRPVIVVPQCPENVGDAEAITKKRLADRRLEPTAPAAPGPPKGQLEMNLL
jgi:hypothetical protein